VTFGIACYAYAEEVAVRSSDVADQIVAMLEFGVARYPVFFSSRCISSQCKYILYAKLFAGLFQCPLRSVSGSHS
jgi:hypothetical protein